VSLKEKLKGRKVVFGTILIPLELKKIMEADKFRLAVECGTTPAYHDLIREWRESHMTLEKQRAEMNQCQDAA